jgi:predicted HTH transcriptional regulator
MAEAMHFLSRHLLTAGRSEPGVFERVDEPLFPPVALLREALVNAFCHREYAQVGGAGNHQRSEEQQGRCWKRIIVAPIADK